MTMVMLPMALVATEMLPMARAMTWRGDGDVPAADGDGGGATCAIVRRARMRARAGQGHLKQSLGACARRRARRGMARPAEA